MRYELKSYNDFCFSLEVVRFGAGISGLTPALMVKSFTTGEYWNGTAWQIPVAVFPMPGVPGMPGLYALDLSAGPNPIDTTKDTKYLVQIAEATQPLTEYILVTVNRFDSIIKDNQNIVQNIADFFDATTGFNAALSTIGTATDVTNTVDANLVDWNGTSPTLSKNATSGLPEVASSYVTPSVKADLANGILDAEIWNPIVNPITLTASPSNRDTVARAIVSSYLTSVHKTGFDVSSTEDIHTCSYSDSQKFYSTTLPSLSVMEKLIKQDAILFKNWSGSGLPDTLNVYQVIMRITEVGIDTNGKYLVLEDVNGDSETYVASNDSIIIANSNVVDPEEIASAVWEEPVADHSTTGTFGLLNRIVAGLVHFNHRIKDAEYDQTGRLTGCRIVVYPSASDAEADTNSLSTIIVSSTYNSGNNMSSYLATEE